MFNRFWSNRRRRPAQESHQTRRRARFESLEDRRLMAVDISINDIAVRERDSSQTLAAFTVSLSEPSDQPVTVEFDANFLIIAIFPPRGVALFDDFDLPEGRTGTLTFQPGETQRRITAAVFGDTLVEGNETFQVQLLNPTNATLVDEYGMATILDDERLLVAAADAGGGPHVKVFTQSLAERLNIFAYSSAYTGGVRVASGDVNGDGAPDVITGTGPGGGPHVRVFDGVTGQNLHALLGPASNFFAYAPAYTGGLHLAAGDFNADGKDDVVTAPNFGGGPHVRVFSGADGSLLSQFFAYASSFTGGVRLAVGDVDADGTPDIITGAGPGGGPHVQAFHLDGSRVAGALGSFFAYAPSFTAGVYVAVGDVNGDVRADIVTGTGAGGSSHVRAFSGADGSSLASFFAYGAPFSGGVRVATGDLNDDGRDEIITAPGPGDGSQVRVFTIQPVTQVSSVVVFAPSFTGGVYVAGTPAAQLPGFPVDFAAVTISTIEIFL